MIIKHQKFKKNTFIAWISVVLIILTIYYLNSDIFDINFLKTFTDNNRFLIIISYLLFLSVLGLFFIPSTPFAIAGLLLFPPAEAYLLNMIGIITSSTIVYYYTRFLGLDDAFESRYPKKIIKLKKALEDKELPIIAGWSFFPIVPTDLI
ncbi:MAG: TVP38/TMEM64 family protein, partial [Candidatus Aenigmarchaeota archaeon]|nr:TVP38/TMEM64 family protein [Candidatus Aenigmarchaeota archaeon]